MLYFAQTLNQDKTVRHHGPAKIDLTLHLTCLTFLDLGSHLLTFPQVLTRVPFLRLTCLTGDTTKGDRHGFDERISIDLVKTHPLVKAIVFTVSLTLHSLLFFRTQSR